MFHSLRLPSFLRLTGCALLLAVVVHAAEPRAFDIPAGKAEQSLQAFSAQAGVELIYSTEIAAGVRTNPVKGTLAPDAALTALLAGTNLEVVRDREAGVLRIARVAPPAAAPTPPEKNVVSRPANDAAAADETDGVVRLEAFAVTGTNIRRVDGETALPVTTLNREDLDARGASTMADLFETLGFAEPSAITEVNNGPQLARGDVASVDLRGMGSGSTLTLINGRRMAPHPISMAEGGVPSLAANINAIPRALVSRVEILRDGASAIYGADAAAGVINSIVSPAGEGRGVRLTASMTEHGGANEAGATLYDSFRLGKTKVSVSVDFYHRDALTAQDREWASQADLRGRAPAPWNGQPMVDANGTTVRDNDFDNTNNVNQWGQWQRGFIQPDFLTFVGSRPTGNTGIVTSTTPPAGVATMSSAGMFYLYPRTDGQIYFKQTAPSKNIDSAERGVSSNWNTWKFILPETDRFQVAAFFDRPLRNNIHVFGDILFYRAHSVTGREPTNFKNTDDPGIYLPAANPYNPFGTRFYHPTGAPNADGTARLVGTPADVSLWTGISPGQNTGGGFKPRETEVFSYSYRALAGLRGRLGETWEWESGLLLSGAQTHEYEHNQVRESRLRQALGRTDPATAFNPFPVTFRIVGNQIVVDKPFTNADSVLEPLYGDEDRFGRTNLFSWDAKVNGRLWSLGRGGQVGLASGLEVRHETYDDKRAVYSGLNPPGSGAEFPFLREGDNDLLALSSNVPISAQQTVLAGYAEVALPFVTKANRLPLVEALELSLAGRFEHFSIFGEAVKPKASLLWHPAPWLKLRGSVAESFRAPNLVQTNITPLRRQFSSDDPYRFQVTALSSDGTAQRVSFRQGNQNLVPEEAQTWTAGFVIDVPKVRGLSLTFDYFSINQNNVIENMGAANVIDRDELLLDLAVQAAVASGRPVDSIDLGSGTANYLGYNKVVRKPVTDADRTAFATYNAAQPTNATRRAPVGEIVSVIDDYINLSGRDIEGYELGLDWRLPKTQLGQFTVSADSTHYVIRRAQAEPGALPLDELERNGRAKWRASASLGWKRGAWSARWFTSYFGSFVDTSAATTEAVYRALGGPDYISVFNDNGITRYWLKVDPFVSHNASVTYRFSGKQSGWLGGLSVRAAVNNVLDEEPPLADEQYGYRTGTANPRGRQFVIELNKKL